MYKNIIISPLNSDICALNIKQNFDNIPCSDIWKGILKSGLIVANIELFSLQNSLYNIILKATSKQMVTEYLNEWENKNQNIEKFNNFFNRIDQIYEYINE